LLFCPTLLSAQTTWYVPDDFPTIQGALASGSVVDTDTIIVRPGTYVENINFLGKAVTLKSELGPEVTIIDGKKAGSVATCRTGEGADTVLQGFTLFNGSGTPTHAGLFGGGMYNLLSTPTVFNCHFIGNTLVLNSSGGGMYNDSASPIVMDCKLSQNYAGVGGGMYNSFSSNPIVDDCIISSNASAINGGGMVNESSSPLLFRCIFSGNSAGAEGGGMSNRFSSNPTVKSCLFSHNDADEGGAMFNYLSNPVVTQSTFVGNSAVDIGGAMYNWDVSDAEVKNCTFIENTAGSSGGAMYNRSNGDPEVANSILWNDTPDEIFNDASFPIVTFSCVEGGYTGDGNIDSDPLFADSSINDLHLRYPSPCRNTGDNAAVIDLEDFEGDPRIAYGTVDMGADEFHPHLYYTGNAAPGGAIEGKFVGLPGAFPVDLILSTGSIEPPMPTMWGLFHLQPPWFLIELLPIPSGGILVLPSTIPADPPAPYDIFMQALIGLDPDSLSNLSVLEVR
jgi:hypothetical protein